MSQPAIMQHCSWVIAACLLSVSVLPSGCGQKVADDSERYTPSPAVAEAALKSSLESWLRGDPIDLVAETNPVVHFIDPHRNPDQSLVRYEILGEVAGNAPRCFAVKACVKAKKDDAEKVLRLKYVVMGLDPLCVWEEQDYLMLNHWDHNMKEPVSRETPKK